MIGIKVISNTNIRNFELNLEKLLAEHPDAKVIFGAIKGIEGGKGMVVVFSYEKKEELINTTSGTMTLSEYDAVKLIAEIEAKKEAEAKLEAERIAKEKADLVAKKKAAAAAKKKATLAAKKAELEAQIAEIEE